MNLSVPVRSDAGLRSLLRALALATITVALGAGPWLADAHAENSLRARVLVYYGNETSERAVRSENYAALFEILRSSKSPVAALAAETIETDARKFPAVAQRDVKDLQAAASRLGFDLALFTNALAFEGRYIFYRHRTGRAEPRTLPALPPAGNQILANTPLARPDFFHAALAEVAGLYPANTLDLVLIVNSHGSGDMAIIPRVSTDLSVPGAKEALARSLTTGEDPDSPGWAKVQGTSKLEFWRIVAEIAAARGVRFPLVFREACASGLRDWAEYGAVPGSVGLIAHTGMRGMDAPQIDYAAIFAGDAADWLARLEAGLSERGIRVNSKRTIWFWVGLIHLGEIHPAYFFAPIALWLAWFGLRTLRQRRRAAV